ncbi:ABC transporter F family member 4 [Iris pallida]|uniref:ABC transporter F family member 4 n=1 Tax=Iris pallida TaxID=29817 RepID=A0AAX6I1H8_IRIPA|nr:ABC transporter F family member 4 [Iris pallida]
MRKRRAMEGGGREFFICFTSRPSSSSAAAVGGGGGGGSMRLLSSSSNKSLTSPGRSNSSSSLSRRLRSSGSIKGGQSPMVSSRKKGGGASAAFEAAAAAAAAEPSSPKVTCIGQVRVKKKKKKAAAAAAMMARSRSREASFRRSRSRGRRNQGWVNQLPFSICEALKALGSELNCFSPSCGGGRGRSGGCSKRSSTSAAASVVATTSPTTTSSPSSCGAVFMRWLTSVQESREEEEEGRREVVRLVVEEREKGNVGIFFRDKDLAMERKPEEEEEEEEEQRKETDVEMEKGRVSVCIPPKNALLLMRCRSDPVKMVALANKFWDSPAVKTVQCEEVKIQYQEEEDVDDGDEEFDSSKLGIGEKVQIHHPQQEKGEDEEMGKGELADLQEEEEEEKVMVDGNEEMDKGIVSDATNLEQRHSADGPEGGERAGEDEEEEEEVRADEPLKGGRRVTEEEEVMVLLRETCEKDLKDGEEGEIIIGRGRGRRSTTTATRCCSSTKASDLAKAKGVVEKRRSSCYSSSKENRERRRHSFSVERGESRRNSFSSEREARRSSFSMDKQGRGRWSFSVDKEEVVTKQQHASLVVVDSSTQEEEKKLKVYIPPSEEEEEEATELVEPVEETRSTATEVRDDEVEKKKGEELTGETKKKRGDLPDCLLLMMYEPKLSMEVSKETWVCSTDFLRWRPSNDPPQPHHSSSSKGKVEAEEGSSIDKDERNESKDHCDENKKAIAASPAPGTVTHRPPPPTRPLPAPPKVSDVEQKPLKRCAAELPQAPYEPFVLTRCKSEPLKSSARLAPDCFWESRHKPIGAAGVGF